LHNDLIALERLRSESSIFRFTTQGDPPTLYAIVFKGRGLWRDRGKVKAVETHRVELKLGSSYPRTVPELRWVTPVYHPNISEIGMVCLGGYGTHWVPSVQLDELCIMLWDMARYHNYDIRSPYNRDAALWVANQTTFRFPTDERPLRDLRAALGRQAHAPDAEPSGKEPAFGSGANGSRRPGRRRGEGEPSTAAARVRHFVNQYGQIFGKGRASAPEQPSPDLIDIDPDRPIPIRALYELARPVPAPIDPAGVESTGHARVALESGPTPPSEEATAPGPLFEPVTRSELEPVATPERVEEADSSDGLIIFEPITSAQPVPAAPRGDDEIVFID
jgi:hypothetical protein